MDAGTSVNASNSHLQSLRAERAVPAVRAGVPGPRRPITLNECGAFNAADVDTARAQPARIEDYLRAGHDNYEVDRDVAEKITAVLPRVRAFHEANRAFLSEAVRRLTAAGVRQVLDIGAGLDPVTIDAARRPDGPARVVLVDSDPVTVVHLQGRWERDEEMLRAVALYGDLDFPETFLRDARLLDVLDPAEPIAVVLGAVLHHLPDDRAARYAVARLMHAMPSGSYLVITHATGDVAAEEAEQWAACYREADIPLMLRTRERIAAFFDGLTLKDQGLVPLETPTQPDNGEQTQAGDGEVRIERFWMYGAVGCKPCP